MNKSSQKAPAIVFIGFRHKLETVRTAQEEGYKTLLLTRKKSPEMQQYFDEVYEENILDMDALKKLVPVIKACYRVKGVMSNYEHYVVHRSFFAEHFGLPSASIYSACCTRNKVMQRHALKFMKQNIESVTVTNLSEAINALKELGGKVYLKAIAGVKSQLVFSVKSESDMKSAFIMLKKALSELDEDLYDDYELCDFQFLYPNPREVFLVERAEIGQQVTVASLVGNHHIWHAPSICDVYTAHDIGRSDSFLAFRILPSCQPKDLQDKAKQVTENAARILGLKNCSLHAEYILREDGEFKLIELASRMGGYRPRMYRVAYDLNLNQMLLKSSIGKTLKTRKAAKQFVSMMEIFPESTGVLKEIVGYENLESDPDVHHILHKYQLGDKVGLAKQGYSNVLSFHITGASYEEVKNKSLYYQSLLRIKTD